MRIYHNGKVYNLDTSELLLEWDFNANKLYRTLKGNYFVVMNKTITDVKEDYIINLLQSFNKWDLIDKLFELEEA